MFFDIMDNDIQVAIGIFGRGNDLKLAELATEHLMY